MNMAEALSREVERVTDLRATYGRLADVPQVNVAPVMAMMSVAIDKAHLAAGSGDVLQVIAAYEALKGFTS